VQRRIYVPLAPEFVAQLADIARKERRLLPAQASVLLEDALRTRCAETNTPRREQATPPVVVSR